MIHRLAGAAIRAVIVAFIVAAPALALPGVGAEVAQMIALIGLVAAILTFVEYVSVFPSLIEFRAAPPLNRMRAGLLAMLLLMSALVVRDALLPSLPTGAASGVATAIGRLVDFPFSPVRLAVLVLPEGAPREVVILVRAVAGAAYVIAMGGVLVFAVYVRLLGWPIRRQAFNVWTNLPMFDPTTGGDVLYRLKRDAHFNLALGFLLPFLLPAAAKSAAAFGIALPYGAPLAVGWTVSIWAFLPASLMMRGIALLRVADLIEEKRRRAYAQSEHLSPA